jgi:hypothetical protein
MKPDTSFVLKSGHFHLLTTLATNHECSLITVQGAMSCKLGHDLLVCSDSRTRRLFPAKPQPAAGSRLVQSALPDTLVLCLLGRLISKRLLNKGYVTWLRQACWQSWLAFEDFVGWTAFVADRGDGEREKPGKMLEFDRVPPYRTLQRRSRCPRRKPGYGVGLTNGHLEGMDQAGCIV